MDALEVDGLVKRFGGFTAVDHASFRVPRGSLFGFLGPNGSGKTTTLGMVTGLIPPDGGAARILGKDVAQDPAAALDRVGALVEDPAFYPYLSGRRNLALLGRLRGVVARDRVDEALARAGLAEAADAKYKGYSMGMKRRLGVAAALLHDPEVVLLDEPTNGLDPAGQLEVRALLRDLAARGRTVLLSSHLLHEVQAICSHVAVIHKGRVLTQGTLADLLGAAEGEVDVVVDDPVRGADVARGVAGVREVRVEGSRLRVRASPDLAPVLNRALVQAGVGVSALSAAQAGLEERFLELTGGAP